MSYRPHPKGARTDLSRPQSWGTCDRTGFINNLDDLVWQYEWAGSQLINKRLLVRRQSADKPQPQFQTLVLPADPRPIMNARVEPYSIDEAGPITTQITVNAAAQAVTLFVQSVTGFAATNNIYVYLDDGVFWAAVISSTDPIANSMVISPPLPSSASVNQIVSMAPAD